MRMITRGLLASALCAVVVAPTAAWAKKCPGDSVQVGDVCVDTYEASVWSTFDVGTITKIKKGKIASAADLSAATQHGAVSNDYGAGCPDTGNGCLDYYAVSVVGVTPSSRITWFQAAATCRNASKRLATNQEWQMAALGTPDPGPDNGTTDCKTSGTAATVPTGSRANCVSDVGAFDMVGNVYEWVADWVPASTACPGWDGFSNDVMCLSGASTTEPGPKALFRGGNFINGPGAGVFALDGGLPWLGAPGFGFRCARHL